MEPGSWINFSRNALIETVIFVQSRSKIQFGILLLILSLSIMVRMIKFRTKLFFDFCTEI